MKISRYNVRSMNVSAGIMLRTKNVSPGKMLRSKNVSAGIIFVV